MSNFYSIVRKELRDMFLSCIGSISHPAPGIHILNGHRTESENESPDVFRHVLKHLSECAQLTKIENAVRLINNRTIINEPIVAFTFDDGFTECYTHFAPALEEFGINGLFFVNPNYVEGDDDYIENFDNHIVMTPGKIPMRWEHLIDLQRRGHIIGAHTMNHFMIASDNLQKLKYEIVNCKSAIEKHIDSPCDYFAFPYGKLSQASPQSIQIACDNYKYVFSQSDYKHYYSFDGKVINRRHFEPFWPISHIDYFLSCHKRY